MPKLHLEHGLDQAAAAATQAADNGLPISREDAQLLEMINMRARIHILEQQVRELLVRPV